MPKFNPFGERKYIPSSFQIKCPCGHVMMIRTAEQIHIEPCWKCSRKIKVVMGMGRNNYSVYVIEAGAKEYRISPTKVDQ